MADHWVYLGIKDFNLIMRKGDTFRLNDDDEYCLFALPVKRKITVPSLVIFRKVSGLTGKVISGFYVFIVNYSLLPFTQFIKAKDMNPVQIQLYNDSVQDFKYLENPHELEFFINGEINGG